MKQETKTEGPEVADARPRRWLAPLVLGLATAAVLGTFALRPGRVASGEAPASAAEASGEEAAVSRRDSPRSVAPAPESAPSLAAGPAASADNPGATSAVPARLAATAQTRQMVEVLTSMNLAAGPLSEDQLLAWRHNLQALLGQGAAGIPAIRDFLELNKDPVIGAANAKLLGHDSVRGALFDVLRQIGGAEGTQALLEELRRTGEPREILTLARHLESLAPGEHQQELVGSARQVLANAARGELPGHDVAPLFEVFQKYGGPEARADLDQALGQWRYYGAIGLANLPDGAGLPSLIQMASGTDGNRTLAMEMLAQVALRYPEAKAALLEQVRAGAVAPRQWPYLASVLGGDHYQLADTLSSAEQSGLSVSRQKSGHIGFGNQNFFQGPPPGGFAPEQLAQQIALVDEILGTTADPAAKQVLQTAKGVLHQRLNGIASVPAP